MQNFQLHLAHQLHMNFPQSRLPHHMQLGVLLLQRAQGAQRGVGVGALGQQHLVVQNRLQQRRTAVRRRPKALSRAGVGGAGHRHHRAGFGLAHKPVFGAAVQPQLVGLFTVTQGVFHAQHAAGDFQVGQPRTLLILTDFEHTCAKFFPCPGLPGPALQSLQQRVHPVQTQRRAEIHREHLPPRNGGDDGAGFRRTVGQRFLHQRLAAQRQRLRVGTLRGKIHAAIPETPLQFPQPHRPVRPRQVAFVHKNKCRYAIFLQKPPQRFGVALHPVGAGDHQHRVVQHLQGALRLGGKVHVPRRVQQRQHRAGQLQHRLLGKNRDAARFFQRVGVQKGVPVVHPAQPPQRPRPVQHRLAQRGLAAVHVGQHAHHQPFHPRPPCEVSANIVPHK